MFPACFYGDVFIARARDNYLLFANVNAKSASASTFGLVSSVPLSWDSCYWQHHRSAIL